jgi:hypothetical protein
LNKKFATYLVRDQNAGVFMNSQGQHSSNAYFDVLQKFLTDEKIVNTMLVTKIFCNLFNSLKDMKEPATQKLLAYILYERNFLFFKLTPLLSISNKVFQVAFSTLLLNYVILIDKLSTNSDKFSATCITESTMEIVQYLNDVKLNEFLLSMDQEAVFRVLVCIGTILTKTYNLKDVDYLKTVYRSLEVSGAAIEKIVSNPAGFENKVKMCAVHILNLFA